MATQSNDRREFLKLGGTALAATAVSWNARSYASIVGANDRVKIGIIGFGDRMKGGDIPAFRGGPRLTLEFTTHVKWVLPESPQSSPRKS